MEMQMNGSKDLTFVVEQMDGDESTQALKLPTLLEGEALAIWLELTVEQQGNYAMAKTEIIKTIMPMGFISLDEFHQRKA